ncbi:hypothetical protein M9Y10_001162 [Tritrichomonas musculus]|uniref:Uncharacterized protein n=1 Tax=Tritrichomonas musculus TaxID=1915356 RepID=A0ABR2L697_9EUKA
MNLYKLNSITSLADNKFEDNNTQISSEDKLAHCNTFNQYCVEINKDFRNNDLKSLIDKFNEFDEFIKKFPLNFFENNLAISQNNIPDIIFYFLHPSKNYIFLYSCITLLNDILFSCQNAFILFCQDKFIELLVSNISSSTNDILRNLHIKALSNILSESNEDFHNKFLKLFPNELIIKLMNSNKNDDNFIRVFLMFICGITLFQTPQETSQLILFIANEQICKFPFKCLQIYKNLIIVHKIYDGFNYRNINNIFSINYEDNDLIIECCIFIHLLLKHNADVKNQFEHQKIASFALCPADSNNYNDKLKYCALLALYDIGNFVNYVNSLVVQFESLSHECKNVAGLIIFDFAKTVTSESCNLLISSQENIFSIAKNLLSTYNHKLMIDIFISMQLFFEITRFSQRTIDMFLTEFPGDTIWQFVETNDDEVNKAGMNFINSCLSDEE